MSEGKIHELVFYDVHGWSNISVGTKASIVTVNKTYIYYALYKTFILKQSSIINILNKN